MFKKLKVPNKNNNDENALGNNRYFDLKLGALGALFLGAVVYYINSDYGFEAASIAAMKQAAYTFFVGGSMVRLSENMATYFEDSKISVLMSVLVPSVLTLVLTYLVHSLKGTPEPLESTLPTLLMAPPSFAVWGNKKRKQLEKLLSEKSQDI